MSATDRSELDGYEALVSELRATPPVAPERLRERVMELGPSQRRRMSNRRRLTFVVVPVAVVLAVGAALVHGFVSSGSNQRRADAAPLAAAKRLTPLVGSGSSLSNLNTPTESVHGSAAERAVAKPAKSTHFQAYQSAAGSSVLKQGSAFDSTANALTIPKNRLTHVDASLQVSVKSRSALSKATNSATQIVSSLGGYAQSVRYESAHSGGGDAFLSLRVPVGKAQAALGRLAHLGRLLSQQVSTRDLQQQLTGQTNGIGSLKRAIAVYEQALNSGSLSAGDRVTIEIKLSNARHAITQLRRNRTATLQSGATSNISLVLTTRQHAFAAPHHHNSTRVGRLLGSAGHFLALEGIIFLYALIVVAPFLLVGALVWWVLRERRRREERLLASA
jgi:hypothetical protein